MVYIKKLCTFEDCGTYSVWGFAENKIRLRCAKHKLENMVNLSRQYCIFEGCSRVPYYGFPEDGKRLNCFIHMKPGMIRFNVFKK
jgi:hypothetical protein